MNSHVLICCWCILLVSPVFGELFLTGAAIGASLTVAGFLSGFTHFKCNWYECCDDNWIPNNTSKLKSALSSRLYGQHLVTDTVVHALKGHGNAKTPEKALVMSFHGWTGGGKNYVSTIIAENLYKKGIQSQYVHVFIAGLHFPHASEVNLYKTQLHQWIRGNVSRCARSLFIFDELDKMHPGILDAIKPFIEYHQEVDGTDYRKSIFIFISNTAGNDINKHTISYWKSGKSRQSISLTEMEKVIHLAAFNEPGGLKFSQLISSHLIDHFIPFLPLERDQVKLCVRDQLRLHGVWEPSDEEIQKVAGMLQYFPERDELFSSSGCKRVQQKVNLFLEERNERRLEIDRDHTDEL